MVEWVDLLIILSLGIKNGLVVVTALNGRYSLGMKLHGGRPSANEAVKKPDFPNQNKRYRRPNFC
jgi:hypothetical protein